MIFFVLTNVICEDKMDDKNLIECVQHYEVLYDLSNPKYMNTPYKNKIWNKIAKQIKCTHFHFFRVDCSISHSK